MEIKATKTETKHFVYELLKDDPYGYPWEQVVDEYLKSGYKKEDSQYELTVLGSTYKVLKREEVTVFYDADGNTLFDVVNERLEEEYKWLMDDMEDGKRDVLEEENTDMVNEETDSEIGETQEEKQSEDEKEAAQDAGAETVKLYSSGEEKLIAEEDEMIASVKPEFKNIMQAQMDLIFKELISWTKQDPEFEKKVLLNHKSMKRCMKFCADKAMGLREPSDQEKAAARYNNIPIMTPVGSDMLFEWIKEYYDKDDKAEVEKEKNAAKAQKKPADKKKAVDKKKADPRETVSKKQEKKSVEKKEDTKATGSPKKQDKLVDGQISLFDLFGV